MPSLIRVDAYYDAAAGVWVASSKDVFGLHAEAEDLVSLQAVVSDLLPDLLRDETQPMMPGSHLEVPVELLAHTSFIAKLSA